ncbi:hypothetical protein BXZ70DRAFT_943239 [Cristinia sonorae]|uniref:Uncharacterized protein n=1 Tax=Cristinia sonorae TaxID=1940300 RepID=A0A8K0XNL7_9AGAR|nr:hypothetical protein BXZ70DRAFT_943239 [Cristinia sonorae]
MPHFRQPVNDWKALHALEHLIPLIPSPALTAEEWLYTPPFGEIPIILDIGIRARLTPMDELEQEDDSGFLDLPQFQGSPNRNSSGSFKSYGTFGPIRRAGIPTFCDDDNFDDVEDPETLRSISTCSTVQQLCFHGEEAKTLRRINSTSRLQVSSGSSIQGNSYSTPLQARPSTSLGFLSASRSESPLPSVSHLWKTRSQSTEALSNSANVYLATNDCSTAALPPLFPTTDSARPRNLLKPRGKVHLPPSMTWLENVILNLSIDQEGFRESHPRFVPVGYTASDNNQELQSYSRPEEQTVTCLNSGLVEFRPISRHVSLFHHGTLEPAPTLRSLQLDDSGGKDYLSRQASLCIKRNGVYVVRGIELNPLSNVEPFVRTGSHRQVQYDWSFEYSVSDRLDSLGRSIPGEKILTPLSFMCSPGLLHPIYGTGKKRGLIQQVKKTFITSNVTARKLRTPPDAEANGAEGFPTKHMPNQNWHNGNRPTHRRFHSAAAGTSTSRPSPVPFVPSTNQNHQPRRRMRQDRANSVSEIPDTPPSTPTEIVVFSPPIAGTISRPPSSSSRRRSITSPVFRIVRHIIPPAEIDELITASPIPPVAPPSTPIISTRRRNVHDANMTAFPSPTASLAPVTALSPPRHHRQHSQQQSRDHETTTASPGSSSSPPRHTRTPSSRTGGLLRRLSLRGSS